MPDSFSLRQCAELPRNEKQRHGKALNRVGKEERCAARLGKSKATTRKAEAKRRPVELWIGIDMSCIGTEWTSVDLSWKSKAWVRPEEQWIGMELYSIAMDWR